MEVLETLLRKLVLAVAVFLVLPPAVLRRSRYGVAAAAAPVLVDGTDCDLLGCGGPYDCYGNGWPNFLPRRPGGRYNIPLSAFYVRPDEGQQQQQQRHQQPDCLLGDANNYLPWVTDEGRLTVRPGSQALDLSNLRLTDRGTRSLVQSLAAMVPLEEVQHLSMANNALTVLPSPTLKKFPSVRLLSLRGNEFSSLANEREMFNALPALDMLRVLDMRNCSLRMLPGDFFRNVSGLRYLFLSHNRITTLPVEVFYPLRNLLHLDLSHIDTRRVGEERIENPFMKLIAGLELNQNLFLPLQNLVFLDLSNTRLEIQAFLALRSIQRRVKYVSYCNIGLPAIVDYLFVAKSIEMLDISYNVGVAQSLHRASFSLLRDSLEVLYFRDSMVQQLSWLGPLAKLRVLNLRGNILRTLNRQHFENLTKLEQLDLSYNYISAWNEQILTHSGALRNVNLRNNSIVILTTDMMYDFSRLTNMGLGGNTIQCSCNYLKFLQNILNNTGAGAYTISAEPLIVDKGGERPVPGTKLSLHNVQLFDYDQSEYFCMNFTSNQKMDPLQLPDCLLLEDELINVELPVPDGAMEELEEAPRTVLYVLASVAGCILAVCAVGLFYYWFHIKYFFKIIKNSAVLSFFNDDTKLYLDKGGLLKDADFHYDVFVSYSNADRTWVLNQLLPNMEGVSQINLCLHERDFEVGYGILENIISCMDRSRCLMLIVSESFLLSHWCQFEMHLAQHRLMETRRDELILVLLQDIPRRKCPKTLGYLLKTKTYIKWPTESSDGEQVLFWKRLHKSLLAAKT